MPIPHREGLAVDRELKPLRIARLARVAPGSHRHDKRDDVRRLAWVSNRTTEELERQMDRFFLDLQRELDGRVAAPEITAVARTHYESLVQDAAINDFIPLLVYRFTKEELVQSQPDELRRAA
jgi:hypothetical protein